MSHNVCCLSACWLWDIRIFYLPCVYLATRIRPRVRSRPNIDGWTRSRASAPPLLCMIINIEAAGEGGARLTSQSKCQSTPIGSSFSGMAAPARRAWRAWCWGGWGFWRVPALMFVGAGRGERELSAQLPLLSVFVWQNGIPDLINTSIRCDCINTALITAEAV